MISNSENQIKTCKMSGSESPAKRELLELRKQEGNSACVDCGQTGMSVN